MKQTSQLDAHVDAESLNAFVERALPDPERLQVLSHIAVCRQCREVLFLAQTAAQEAELPAAVPTLLPVRQNAWFTNWRFAWVGALACAGVAGVALLFGVLHRTRTVIPGVETTDIAKSDQAIVGGIGKVAAPGPEISAPPSPVKLPSSAVSSLQSAAESHALNGNTVRPAANEVNRLQAISPTAQDSASTSSNIPGEALDGGLNALTSLPAAPRQAPSAPAAKGSSPVTGMNEAVTVDVQPAPLLQTEPPELTTTISAASLDSVPLQGRKAASQARLSAARPALAKSNSSAMSAVGAPQGMASASAGGASGGSDFRPSSLAKQPAAPDDAAARRILYTRLPDGLIAISTAAVRPHLLALDSDGGLFLSEDLGKTWEPVAPRWSGRALEVRVQNPAKSPSPAAMLDTPTASCPNCAASPATEKKHDLFELVTDSVAVWTSEDGKTWKQK